MFDFLPEARALEEAFAEGDIHDTEDVTEAEIVDTIRKATAGKVGAALLTDDGVFTVRMMMASLMHHTECDAQSALEHIQGQIWERIGCRPDTRLNCYSLIFKRLCAELHTGGGVIDSLMSDDDHLKACIRAEDYADRLHPNLFGEQHMPALHRIIDRYGEDTLLQATAATLREPGGSAVPRHHISTWGYFVPVIEENNRRAQMSAAGIAPGDVLGEGLRMDVPF